MSSKVTSGDVQGNVGAGALRGRAQREALGSNIKRMHSGMRTRSMMGTLNPYGEEQTDSQRTGLKEAAEYVKAALHFKRSIAHAKSDIKLLHVKEAKFHEPGEFILHPLGEFRSRWDQVTALLIIWMCFYVPFKIAFSHYLKELVWKIIGIAIDAWFVADIYLNFHTGFVHNGYIIMDLDKIYEHYADPWHGWLLIDVLGSIPIDYIFEIIELIGVSLSGAPSGTQTQVARKLFKTLKWLKLPKLLRLSRLAKKAELFQRFSHIITWLFCYIVFTHFFACIWLNLVDPCRVSQSDDYNIDFYDPSIHKQVCPPEIIWDLYARSFHACSGVVLGISPMQTWFDEKTAMPGFDYGNYSSVAHWFSFLVMTFGAIFVSVLIGLVTLLLSNYVGTSWAFKGKMDNLKSEMEYYRVPQALAKKVNKYYEYLWLNRKHFGDSSLLRDEDMSVSLRRELSLHLYKDMIIKVPFFQNESDDFLARVCMNLTTEIYLPGDEIVREGDVGRELYIINKGKVKITGKERGLVGEIGAGSFFGEIALLEHTRRTLSIFAVTMCELNVLDQETFDAIVAEYPSFKFKMERLAYRRQSKDRRHTRMARENKDVVKRRESDIVQQTDLLDDLDEDREIDSDEDEGEENHPLNKEVKEFVRRTSKAINMGQGARGSIIDVPLRNSIDVDKPNFFGHEDDGQLAVLQDSEYRRISKSPALLAAAVAKSNASAATRVKAPPRAIFKGHQPSFAKVMKRSDSSLGSIVENNEDKGKATRSLRLDSMQPRNPLMRRNPSFTARARRESSVQMAYGAQAFLARMDPSSSHASLKGGRLSIKDKGSALRNMHLLNKIDSNVDTGIAEIHNRIEVLETRIDEWMETLVEALGVIHGDVEEMRQVTATKREMIQSRSSLQNTESMSEQQRQLLNYELSKRLQRAYDDSQGMGKTEDRDDKDKSQGVEEDEPGQEEQDLSRKVDNS